MTGVRSRPPWLSAGVWILAWQDARGSRKNLAGFASAMAVGVMALALVASLAANLRRSVELQTRTLLGADLVLNSRQKWDDESTSLTDRIASVLRAEQAEEIHFSSMLNWVSADRMRLVQMRALRGNFPWYGEFAADPPESIAAFRRGEGVLVESSLAAQFGGSVGDAVQVGELRTKVAGVLKRIPGDAMGFGTLAPRVYISWDLLPQTGLLKPGSLARYRKLMKTEDFARIGEVLESEKGNLSRLRIDADTVEKRRGELEKSIGNLERYLQLAGLVALLLGAGGMAGALGNHLRRRKNSIAILRCLGAGRSEASAVYWIQALALIGVGIGMGLIAARVVSHWLPEWMGRFVSFPIDFSFAWFDAVGTAFLASVVVLAWLVRPLREATSVTPSAVLRSSEVEDARRDPLVWIGFGLSAVVVWTWLAWRTGRPLEVAGWLAGLLVSALVLVLAAKGIVQFARWISSGAWADSLPFACRYAVASLHRPNNRTGLLMVILGLGTFLLTGMRMTRDALVRDLFPLQQERQPNAILFDIQSDQRDGVAGELRSMGLSVMEEAPIITMRLASVAGRPVQEILASTNRGMPDWVLRREYRSTWKSALGGAEKIVAGEWIPRATEQSHPEGIPISVEVGIARDLKIGLNDLLDFDIQGVPMRTRVASLREVDWRQVRPNFFMVFPEGSLDGAPMNHVMAVQVRNAGESADMQRRVTAAFPNVSIVDLMLVREIVEKLVEKLGWAVRALAWFTLGAGALVLLAILAAGRDHRREESVILRTLGAAGREVRAWLWIEHGLLGVAAGMLGAGLAWLAAFLLLKYAFRSDGWPALAPMAWAVLLTPWVTIVVGWWFNRGIDHAPPLEVLRRE